jgi:hypothetical protein
MDHQSPVHLTHALPVEALPVEALPVEALPVEALPEEQSVEESVQVVDGNNIEVVANAGGAGASASGAGGRLARKRVNNFAGSNNNQIVTNLSFTETFDGDKLAYVVEHWDQLDGLAAATLQEDGFQPSLDRARRYLEASQDMRVTVTYHQVGDTDIGRCYAKRGLSLQSLPRKVRHTVASGAYTDVDMVNAFPVLLLHECRKAGIECPYLAQYVAQREDLLAELPCSRDVAKKTYLAVMNGGNKDVNNLKKLNQTTPHLLGFQTEMKCVYKKFAELHPAKYATVVERRTKQHKSYNHEAGLVTTILCELENQVLMTIWDFFGRPQDCVFCFDGIMLRANREYDLVACQLEVKRKLDVEIQLNAKPFGEQLQLPSVTSVSGCYAQYMQELEARLPETTDVTNEAVGEHFFRRFRHDVLYNTLGSSTDFKLCFWDPHDKTWAVGKERVLSWIYSKVSKEVQADYKLGLQRRRDMLRKNNQDEKEEEMLKNAELKLVQLKHDNFLTSTRRWIQNALLADTSIRRPVQFNLESTATHYFQFKNGAFNLKTLKLEPRTRDMYVTAYLPYDYRDAPDAEKVQKLRTIMEQIHPQAKFREAFLAWRGYCLTGERNQQCFVLNIGFTAENGKSTLSKMFALAFPLYCQKVSSKCLDMHAKEYNKTFSALRHKPYRLLIMEEWGGQAIDVNTLKDVVDGETLAIQPLYSEEVNMPVNFKLEASSNHEPNVNGMDKGLNRRGRVFHYESQFVAEEDAVDPAQHRYKRDDTISSLFGDTGYCLALFHILAPYAKQFYMVGLQLPSECKLGFAEAVADSDPWADFFDTCVEADAESSVWKDDALKAAKEYCNLSILPDWKDLKQQFQKRDFRYNSQMLRKAQGVRKKGFIVGCVIKAIKVCSKEAHQYQLSSERV